MRLEDYAIRIEPLSNDEGGGFGQPRLTPLHGCPADCTTGGAERHGSQSVAGKASLQGWFAAEVERSRREPVVERLARAAHWADVPRTCYSGHFKSQTGR